MSPDDVTDIAPLPVSIAWMPWALKPVPEMSPVDETVTAPPPELSAQMPMALVPFVKMPVVPVVSLLTVTAPPLVNFMPLVPDPGVIAAVRLLTSTVL
jgi:hypothetical protein